MAAGGAPGVRRRRPDRLHALVAGLAVVAVLAQLAVAALTAAAGPVAALAPGTGHALLRPAALTGLLLALAVAADLVAVRVRHGEHVEELTLLGAAVVPVVLLLPALPSLVVPAAASAACSLLRGRGPLKTVFNAANVALATAGLVGVLHAVSGPGQGLSARTVAGLAVGSAAFAALNLAGLSLVLAVVTGQGPWRLAREGVRLSALEAVGTVALGGTFVTTAGSSPALLPFALAPAAALTFAYRAAAQEAEERQRSGHLLALSQVLAGRRPAEEVLDAFLDLTRQAFGADVALALVDDGELDLATGRTPAGATCASADERALLRALARLPGPQPVAGPLPGGWVRAVCAPLEADGRRVGTVLLATRDRHRVLGARELAVLTPLAGALAAALSSAGALRRLVAETAKLTAVVDHAGDGIVVLDGMGLVQLWSPAAAELSGVAAEAALGRAVDDLLTVSADGRPTTFTAVQRLLEAASPSATAELVVRRADGEERVVQAAHTGVFDAAGRLERDVVIVHDVTRVRQVERLKADFIATVSHELRTPVTPIKGYADLLRRRGDAMTPEKRDECLGVIVDRAEHLSRLVEDLLLASRMSATSDAGTRVERAPLPLAALVARACSDFGDDGDRVTLGLPEHPVTVLGDPVRVVQVLTNLVGNALKYSAAGSPVHVRLTVRAASAVVEVSDHGRGIPADQLERVFDKFHRVEDPLRMTTSGTGLGLYIARRLAEAMGGELDCSSTLGVGSVFRFTLPLASGAALEAPDPRAGLVREDRAGGPDGAGLPAAPALGDLVPPVRSRPPSRAAGPAGAGTVVPPRPRRAPPWATPPPRPGAGASSAGTRTLG